MEILTIAIPSHNGSEYIQKTIDSIIESVSLNNSKYLKILICDNGSSSPIAPIISKISLEFDLSVDLYSFDDDLGYDLNVLRMIKICTTEYVWLMGDDDLVINNSVNTVILNLLAKPRAVVFMKPIFKSLSHNDQIPRGIEYNLGAEFFQSVYLGSSLLSTLIFRRDLIPNLPNILIGNNWIHIVILGLISRTEQLTFYEFTTPSILRVDSNPERWSKHFNSNLVSGLNHVVVVHYFRKMLSRKSFLEFIDNRAPRPTIFISTLKSISNNKIRIIAIYFYFKICVIYIGKLKIKLLKLFKLIN